MIWAALIVTVALGVPTLGMIYYHMALTIYNL